MNRSRLVRGLALLALAALAVAVVSPAFSAAPLTKAKVKKIVRKEIKKLAPSLTVGTANALSSQADLNYQAAAGTSAQVIYENSNLRLTATCAAGPALTLVANTTVDNATIQSYGNAGDTNDNDFDVAESPILSSSNEERDVVYTTPGGQVIVFQYAAAEGTLYGGSAGCIVKGLLQVV